MLDVRKRAAVLVPVTVFVLARGRFIVVMVFMSMCVVVPMLVAVMMLIVFRFIVVMVVFKKDIELGSRDMGALLLRNVQMVAIQAELLQVMFKAVKINAQIQ